MDNNIITEIDLTSINLQSLNNITYQWKEVAWDEKAQQHFLITPHADPMQYEYPIDFCWDNKADALKFIKEQLEDWGIDEEEAEDWVLIKETQEILQGIK